MKTFVIDYVRQLIEQTLTEEHIKKPTYFGGINQVKLFSFYEQLSSQEEVDRFVEVYRDLTNQQNRTGLIMNGVLLAPENPTMTNINNAFICPLTFSVQFRVKLADRDSALETLNHMVDILKGRKHDIAELKSGKLFKVGTIANNVNGNAVITNGDYIGDIPQLTAINTYITNKLTTLASNDIAYSGDYPRYLYYGKINALTGESTLKCAVLENSEGTWENITPSEHTDILVPREETFTKYKMSMSFDSVKCDEPRTLNAEEYCTISFGGSATIVSANVLLGNELTKVGIKKTKIVASSDINITDTIKWLEPLEMPSNVSADTQVNRLLSNKFITNTHTDGLTISNQYSFILEKDNDFLMQLFKYARYGIQANGTTILYTNGISPNMIFQVKELWSSWGNVDTYTFNAKIIESVEIENTESDVLSITLPLQIQGDNN